MNPNYSSPGQLAAPLCLVGQWMRCLAAIFLVAGPCAAGEAEESAAGDETITLFDGKSLDDWKWVESGGSASVELRNKAMRIGAGAMISGVVYRKVDVLPVIDYEIDLQARRVDGTDFFLGLTFPVRDKETSATLVLGGWGGGLVGISSIDRLDAANNDSGTHFRFEDERWYRIRLAVTDEALTVWIDDEKVIDTDIRGKRISLRPGPIEDFPGLSLTTFQTVGEIRDVRLRPLSNSGADGDG